MIYKLNIVIKSTYKKCASLFFKKYFKQQLFNHPFCIISNDCWGGEIYKIADRQFNTPFIGLMLMAPCYLELLGDLKHCLKMSLIEKKVSKYGLVNELHSKSVFPIGTLGNSGIEISFLHYKSFQEAEESWKRRMARMDWENIFVKFDCGKDYCNAELVGRFLSLQFPQKIVFGKDNYGFKEVIVTVRYSTNSLEQFRNCLMHFNPFMWIAQKDLKQKSLDKYLTRIAATVV